MVVRRLFVFFLAAAFIYGGSALRASLLAPSVAQDHHASMVAAPDVQQGHAAHQGHGSHDSAGVTADDHDHAKLTNAEHDEPCLKCCTMCGVASMTADYHGTPVMFAYGTVRFRIGQRHLLGHLVALDPDIPKSFV